MGRIAEALRSNLRDLAQADARLLRELDDALPTDGLDALSVKQLKERCRQRGLKGISGLRKQEMIARLRALHGAPAPAAVAAAARPGSNRTGLEARLDRLEALLLRIAAHLGVEP